MHSLATVICQMWGEIQEKYRECGSILTILRGVHVTASKSTLGVDLNTSGGILYGRATILRSYK